MGNCLITALKGEVDNNALMKLGETRLEFLGNFIEDSNSYCSISSSVAQRMEILTQGVTFDNGETYIDIVANSVRNFKTSGPCVISIPDKYHLKSFTQGQTAPRIKWSLGEFKYSEADDLRFIKTSGNEDITGDLSELANLNLVIFRTRYSKITGDINVFSNKNFDAIDITDNSGIYGSINNLGDTNLRLVHFGKTSNVDGSFEKMLQNAMNKGKADGTCELEHSANTKVVNVKPGNGIKSYATFTSTGCTIRTAASGGGDLVATCVKSGTAGSYSFTWTDGNGNTYVPTY